MDNYYSVLDKMLYAHQNIYHIVSFVRFCKHAYFPFWWTHLSAFFYNLKKLSAFLCVSYVSEDAFILRYLYIPLYTTRRLYPRRLLQCHLNPPVNVSPMGINVLDSHLLITC